MLTIPYAGPTRSRSPLSAEARALLLWLLCWVVLPNLGFCILWIVGAPPRDSEILVAGVVGLIARRQSYAVRVLLFLGVLSYAVASFIAGVFNLALASLAESIQFAAELHPADSPEYLIAGGFVVATAAAAAVLLRDPATFRTTRSLALAVAAVGAMTAFDGCMSYGMRGAYKRSAPQGAPFSSAVTASQFAARADGRRDMILVIVEAMGQPVDPAARAYLTHRWRAADVQKRYGVTLGTTPYFGSTTTAEMRELCGRWGDYPDVLDRADPTCLPARLAKAGYHTTAMHGFQGDFFARRTWYPHVGFERMLFRQKLMAEGTHACPGVFPGACGRDVPRVMRGILAERRGQPQFLYWLTVNSHLPVPADPALGTATCRPGRPSAIAAHAMICRQFNIWDDVFDSLAREITRPDFPDADILIVGDHMPPYFDRAQRSQFVADRVPWILLKSRPLDQPQTVLAGE